MQATVTEITHKRTRFGLSAMLAAAILVAPVSANAATTSNGTTAQLTSTFQLPTSIKLPTPPTVTAASVLLMDADNGQILYEKNPNERRAPASTTKIMTMLLVMEALAAHKVSWTDIVPVTPDAYKVATEPGVSDAYLDPRQKLTLEQMMKYVAVLSANDATVAVGDFIGGDKQSFVQLMNQKAQKLGMTGTHYMNADGLPVANHYSTAHDLAILARYLIEKYPDILRYSTIPTAKIQNVNTGKSFIAPNTDELIGKYPGLDGLKTGFTSEAGYCFVGTAKQNGVRLISVVLGSKSNATRFSDTQKLFDYGFHQFSEQKLLTAGQKLKGTIAVPDGKSTEITATASTNVIMDLPTGVTSNLTLKADTVSAPIKKGDPVGKVDFVVNNQVISSDAALAATDDGKANFIVRFWRHIAHAIGQWFSHLLHRL